MQELQHMKPEIIFLICERIEILAVKKDKELFAAT